MRSPESLARLQAEMRVAQLGGRRGRPRLPLDAIAIFELAQLGLSNRAIAAQLGCNHKTLRRFAPDLERARLRRQTLLQMEDRRLLTQENSWRALEAELKRVLPTRKLAPAAHGGEKRKR